jgi:hypothetical protein
MLLFKDKKALTDSVIGQMYEVKNLSIFILIFPASTHDAVTASRKGYSCFYKNRNYS